MRAIIIVIIAALVVALGSGCASIIHGTKQTVTINSSPSGAKVVLNNGRFQGVTPATFELMRNGNYNVSISKKGYESQHLTINRTMDPWLLGNILFGGLIGIVIDLADGAASKLGPDQIMVNLVHKEAQAAPPSHLASIIRIVKKPHILKHLRVRSLPAP